MEQSKLVTRTLSTARKANERAELLIFSCKLNGECPLLAKGQCIHLNTFSSGCVYGSIRRNVSPTHRSKKYYEYLKAWQSLMSETPRVQDAEKRIAYIGDYVYLPYAHMNHDDGKGQFPFLTYSHIFSFGSAFMPREKFTAELVAKLVEFKPRTFMDNQVISAYVKESLPAFLTDLSEYDPDLFSEVAALKPEILSIADQAKLTSFDAGTLRQFKFSGRVSIGGIEYFHYSDGEVQAKLDKLDGFPASGKVEVKFYPTSDTQCMVLDRKEAIKVANWKRANSSKVVKP